MFGKKEKKKAEEVRKKEEKHKIKLTREEKAKIKEAIRIAKNENKHKKSAQDSIPFERIWPDGICRVREGYYTKTIQFQDINYQLSQD